MNGKTIKIGGEEAEIIKLTSKTFVVKNVYFDTDEDIEMTVIVTYTKK